MHTGLHADLTDRIIGDGIEVHRHLGPGLLESVYESALCIELTERGLSFTRQVGIPLFYKGQLLSEHRPDLVVANSVIVEVKAVDSLERIHTAQLLTCLRVAGLRVGLVVNFNSETLVKGTKRIIL